jgi:hypothetical protein
MPDDFTFWNAVWKAYIEQHASSTFQGYPVLEVDGVKHAISKHLAKPECIMYVTNTGMTAGMWRSTYLRELIELCKAHYTKEELQTFQLVFELQGSL